MQSDRQAHININELGMNIFDFLSDFSVGEDKEKATVTLSRRFFCFFTRRHENTKLQRGTDPLAFRGQAGNPPLLSSKRANAKLHTWMQANGKPDGVAVKTKK